MIASLIAGKLLQAPELRRTRDGQTITIASVRARIGKNGTEVWQVHAHDRAAQVALMRMNAGDFVALQGVPNTRTASIKAKLSSSEYCSPRWSSPSGQMEAAMRSSPEDLERDHQLLLPPRLDWLKRLRELGVSIDALCEPELPAQAQVVMHRGAVFDFADEADETKVDAVIFLARDELGDPSDLVAWDPRLDRMAGWYGAAPLLGAENIFSPRLDLERALQVDETPLHWLLAEREGVVIVHPQWAAPILREYQPLRVADAAFGQRLARLVNPKPPRIYVPSVSLKRAA